MNNCTVRNAVSGVCGKPAIYGFRATTGEMFYECAEHYEGAVPYGILVRVPRVGDRVTVRRHGKVYDATVVRVGARGAVYAEVTYGNGAKRVVRWKKEESR